MAGKRIYGRMLRGGLRAAGLYGVYLIGRRGALVDDGWFRSAVEESSVDRNGQPIPWITYPAIHYLQRRVRPTHRVFEYGSGNSTLWWARHVREVVSVEHDLAWYRAVSQKLPPNASLHYCQEEGEYARYICGKGPFDVVVLDGLFRVECARHAVAELGEGGVIVWDNSGWSQFADGLKELENAGFRRLEFVGLSPIKPQMSETSILYRKVNCLGI